MFARLFFLSYANLSIIIGLPWFLAAVSTSGTAHTQGWSCAPKHQRSRRNNPCFCMSFDFLTISIQTILLVLFLPVFPDEPAHVTLQVSVVGSGIGCLLSRTYRTYKHFREQPNRLPQTVSVSPGSEVCELQIGLQCQRYVRQNWWF